MERAMLISTRPLPVVMSNCPKSKKPMMMVAAMFNGRLKTPSGCM
jgi:hypothetical protein